jgi:hypothetical protein
MAIRGSFEGVVGATGVTITSPEDRTVFSFLWDNFVVEWLETDGCGDEVKEGSRYVSLAVPEASSGMTLAAYLKGARFGALGGAARLTARVAGRTFEVELAASEEAIDIDEAFETVLEAGVRIAHVEIAVLIPRPDPAGRQALVALDSMDITLRG